MDTKLQSISRAERQNLRRFPLCIFAPLRLCVRHSHPIHLLPSLCALLLALTPLYAQTPVDHIYTWDNEAELDGWTHGSALVELSNPGDYLNMTFRKQTIPYCVTDIAWTDVEPDTLTTNISLRFKPVTIQPSAMRLYLHSRDSGNMWYITLPTPNKGEWTDIAVPIKFSEGWIMGASNSEQQFQLDIQSVDWVGIYVRRHGTPDAQSYNIDDFRIQGYAIEDTYDTDGDGISDAWEITYGMNINNPADAELDKDQDGMSNYDEYRSGTSPTNPDSLLELSINVLPPDEGEPQTGITIQWPSAINRSYSVWLSTNLGNGFEQIGSGIPGTPPVNLFNDTTATNSGPYFYKVTVE